MVRLRSPTAAQQPAEEKAKAEVKVKAKAMESLVV